jgi:type II secretory pathway component PulM
LWPWPKFLGLHKRVSALESWRAQHVKEIGTGGAAQRVEELAKLIRQVREISAKMAVYEDELSQAIRTSNDNLNMILRAVADMEQAIRKDTRPIVAMFERLNHRVGQLEWKANVE